MKTVADALKVAHEGLNELEARVRAGMVNKNLADIIASARGKLAQGAIHPDAVTDLDALDEKKADIEKRAEDPFFNPEPSKPAAPVDVAPAWQPPVQYPGQTVQPQAAVPPMARQQGYGDTGKG